MFRKVILRTSGMFDGHDPQDVDYELWKSIAQYMDGEIALVGDDFANEGQYAFLGLQNSEKDKELAYMMEQDSMTGAYINDREGFKEIWRTGEYEHEGCFYLERDCLELIEDNDNQQN